MSETVQISRKALERWAEAMDDAAAYVNVATRSPSMECECQTAALEMRALLVQPDTSITIDVKPLPPEFRLPMADVIDMAADGVPQAAATAAHPDDLAVNRFAVAMKAKLAASRAKGRGGWDDPAQCGVETLARMLVEHIAKGDATDVANFAMMLHQRGAGPEVLAAATAAQPPALPPAVIDWRDTYAKYLAAVAAYNTRLAAIREREKLLPHTFGEDNPHAEYEAMENAKHAVLDLMPLYTALCGIGPQGVSR